MYAYIFTYIYICVCVCISFVVVSPWFAYTVIFSCIEVVLTFSHFKTIISHHSPWNLRFSTFLNHFFPEKPSSPMKLLEFQHFFPKVLGWRRTSPCCACLRRWRTWAFWWSPGSEDGRSGGGAGFQRSVSPELKQWHFLGEPIKKIIGFTGNHLDVMSIDVYRENTFQNFQDCAGPTMPSWSRRPRLEWGAADRTRSHTPNHIFFFSSLFSHTFPLKVQVASLFCFVESMWMQFWNLASTPKHCFSNSQPHQLK